MTQHGWIKQPYEGKHIETYSKNHHHYEPQPKYFGYDLEWYVGVKNDTHDQYSSITGSIETCWFASMNYSPFQIFVPHFLNWPLIPSFVHVQRSITSNSWYWDLVKDEFSKMSVDREELIGNNQSFSSLMSNSRNTSFLWGASIFVVICTAKPTFIPKGYFGEK